MFNITNTHILLFTIAEVSKTEMHLGIELEDTARVTIELPLASGSCGNVMLFTSCSVWLHRLLWGRNRIMYAKVLPAFETAIRASKITREENIKERDLTYSLISSFSYLLLYSWERFQIFLRIWDSWQKDKNKWQRHNRN